MSISAQIPTFRRWGRSLASAESAKRLSYIVAFAILASGVGYLSSQVSAPAASATAKQRALGFLMDCGVSPQEITWVDPDCVFPSPADFATPGDRSPDRSIRDRLFGQVRPYWSPCLNHLATSHYAYVKQQPSGVPFVCRTRYGWGYIGLSESSWSYGSVTHLCLFGLLLPIDDRYGGGMT